ncbi:MAG TPA: DUF732 domain-containing protein [Mycobacterium sp.]|jgi:hypothetical protein
MAEPGPAADKTVGLNNDETVAAPNSAARDAADPAWSSDDDNDAQRDAAGDRQSWRATWRIAAALVAAGLVLAGAIVFGRSLLSSHTNAAPKPAAPSSPKDGATPAPTAPATGSAQSAAPSSIVSTPDQDNKYVQALNDRGISFANPDAAIANGKMVCNDIRRGVSVPQITAAFRASNPGLADHADTYVTISVHTYCPQNNNLVGGGP